MGNEAKTENLVRDMLRKQGYYDDKDIVIEEKMSDNPSIDKLLKYASKKGSGAGYPEFIIHSKQFSGFLIVIECKADASKHESKALNNYPDYAVDGTLLYGSYLSKEYDVLAIGISGEKLNKIKISHYLLIKGTDTKTPIFDNDILTFSNYYEEYSKSTEKKKQDYKVLSNYFKELNTLLLSKKIEEKVRSLLISGILIALRNKAFKQGYKDHNTAQDLVDTLVDSITKELKNSQPPVQKLANLTRAFSFMKTHTTLSSDKEFLEFLISDIDDKINSFLKTYRYYDAVGQFYIEFLRYANNDKTLGIVLTPPHITELFVELAGINKDSIVLDNCCGTSGFLIIAMRKMDLDAVGNAEEIKKIHTKRLIGIEFQDDVYALSVSNMIVHGDGKTNFIPGDCFEKVDEVKQKYKPTVGLLNPPYKPPDSGKEVKEELEFVLNNLEMLEPNGTCIAIIPMSCALGKHELKARLLEKHTLVAVMSMPDQLFHDSDAGVVTWPMVFTAHVPHQPGNKTWFGYWKDDKFVKVKNQGRIDKFNMWNDTKERWVNSFLNKEVKKDFSLMHEVTAIDEWCAEAYMETDYSKLSQSDFIKVIKDYVSYETFKR